MDSADLQPPDRLHPHPPIHDRKSTRLLQSPCNLVCRLLLEKMTLAVRPSAASAPVRAEAHRQVEAGRRRRQRPGARRGASAWRKAIVPAFFVFFFFNDTATT